MDDTRIVTREIIYIQEECYCDCGGQYEHGMLSLSSDKFNHECNRCGDKVELEGIYPKRYEKKRRF